MFQSCPLVRHGTEYYPDHDSCQRGKIPRQQVRYAENVECVTQIHADGN